MKLESLTKEEKALLEKHGYETRCRCPKPCNRHSEYYRREHLRIAQHAEDVAAAKAHDKRIKERNADKAKLEAAFFKKRTVCTPAAGRRVFVDYEFNDGRWFHWIEGEDEATIDGRFTPAELEAIANGMRWRTKR